MSGSKAFNPSVTNTFREFMRLSPVIGEHKRNPNGYNACVQLMEQAVATNPNVVPNHVSRVINALRAGSDPQRLLEEVEQKVDSYRNYPWTNVGGNLATWQAISEAIKAAFLRESSTDGEKESQGAD